MRFRLKSGVFDYHGKRIKANPNGQPSEPFDSPTELDKIFKNKFIRLEEGTVSAPEAPRVPSRSSIVPASAQVSIPAPIARVQADVRKRVTLPVPPAPPKAPPAPTKPVRSVKVTSKEASTAGGVNVTEKFTLAKKRGLTITRRGIHYTALDTQGTVLVAGVDRKAMDKFLAE